MYVTDGNACYPQDFWYGWGFVVWLNTCVASDRILLLMFSFNSVKKFQQQAGYVGLKIIVGKTKYMELGKIQKMGKTVFEVGKENGKIC